MNGTRVALAGVTGGRASVRLSSHNGDAIPSVRPGDRLEVSHRSVVLLEGSFRPD